MLSGILECSIHAIFAKYYSHFGKYSIRGKNLIAKGQWKSFHASKVCDWTCKEEQIYKLSVLEIALDFKLAII